MLNPNLMNPTIVTRIAEEREREMRSQICELHEDVSRFEEPKPQKPRTQIRLNYAHFAWLHAFMMR